jgi:DNA-directed RNA polymerase specialized sigma24 family protein
MNPRSGRASEFEQHRRKRWRIAYRMLGSQDEAEDMVQEPY